RGRLRFDEPEPGREWTVFLAALRTALFVSLLYCAISLARSHAQGDASAGVRDDAVVLAWSVLSHLVLFLALSATFVLVIASARLARTPARAELALSALVAGGVVFVGVREVVLAALSLTGPLADLWAALFALAIVAVLVGAALDGFARRDEAIRDGLAAVLSPLTLAPSSPALARGGALLLVGGAAFAIATNVAVYDWNYLVQKLSVGVVWCLAFALLYTAATRSAGRPGWAAGVLVTAVLALVAFRALETHSRKVSAWLGADAADAAPVLARHSGYDASFKVLYDALAPRIADAASGSAFYRFLQENTNISRATKVDPVDVNLVDDLKPTPGPKPNVFIFVIDSLRRDYLGPYNAAVRFTPSIDAFARESVVMESAFTRYGATGLSEPSIWVGGMMLHKQYIEPFHPMNALQKLLETDRYQSYVSVDTILSTVVRPDPSIVELDQGVLNKDYDLCHSLEDLSGKLRDRRDRSRPVFAYTQPQNLHVAQITRQSTTVVDGESYPGFYAPYASRLKRIDRCFGEFIAMLKAEKTYDDSIVILTADHGDSLGEEGRWGHAYTMFPEIVRIPLIVHLPPAMRANLVHDRGEVAFLTDITPTLYYLLGHRPVRTEAIFGRPLFTEKGDAPSERGRDETLLASSYGPVYAILSDNGRSLYVADGVNYKDYVFALDGNSADARPVTSEVKRERERQIREQIGEINRFYRFSLPSPG